MFRQSVRQAMKGIAGELEAMQRKAVTSTATCKITARIGRIVQLISEVMQKVHLVSSVANQVSNMLYSNWVLLRCMTPAEVTGCPSFCMH